ncbi:putative calcium-transporting ATPase 13, plasma membrane-type [Camellia lanceoleosa]|uniref:Calcium-transporting ATPase 13, plasma membrane-type n=1 Tax=Camellia lanceoleosa TaxID=1840588 RepID=A0ACC0HI23_9ERIC|nr:putative calcium-transporting ATPase 13, plasma membrane-type [Camellia lanceoleosa]
MNVEMATGLDRPWVCPASAKLVEKHDGVQCLASDLKTNLEHGINWDDKEDILRRHEAFGTNTYPRPPTKCFYRFVWEALKDPTILILLVCAALSLGFGIKENGLKEGWYEGGSISVAVFLVIAVSAGSNFKQNRQFLNLCKVSNNIQIDVVRNGRRKQVLIFEIVVGDVVCLKIGDLVPAYELFIDGHSLQVDESSMTGESEHVEVNLN